MQRKVLAISGRIGSGKSTLAESVALRLGWPWGGFGRYIRSIADGRGLPKHRDSLQALGASLLQKDCDEFCRGALQQAGWSPGESVVLEGVRHSSVVSVLRRLVAPSTFCLVFLETIPELLEARRQRRDLPGEVDWDTIELHSTESEVVATTIKGSADLVLDASLPVTQLVDQVVQFLCQD